MANEYLKRTPTSTGNRRVFTISAWVKCNNNSSGNALCNTHESGSTFLTIRTGVAGNSNSVLVYTIKSGVDYSRYWSIADRDHSSWAHHLFAFNSTALNVDDRVIYYRNGVKVTGYNDIYGSIPLNYDFDIDPSRSFEIFRNPDAGTFGKGQLSDYFFVDGQALTPDVFGFYKDGDGYQSSGTTNATDFRPGQWVPKSPSVIKNVINDSGGFGVNGFYLPMNDSSNNGADFHCDPNSIITLKGEDLPQPRNGAPTTSDAYVSQLRSDPYAANLVLAVPGISTATGINQVVNGNFDNGTTSWTASTGATLTNPEGTLRVTVTQTAGAEQTISGLTVGERYTLSFRVKTDGTNFSNLRITMNGVQSYIGNQSNTDWEQINYSFTTTNSTVVIYAYKATGGWAEFDDFVLKQEDAPRDYSADIKGSGTNKTLTPNGTAGVGYELGNYYGSAMNFDGTSDYFSVANSSDFDFGSGDFTVEYWQNATSFAGSGGVGIWDNTNNQRSWLIYQGSNTYPRFYVSTDGITSVNSNPTGPSIATNQWTHYCMERNGSDLVGYVNGVCVGMSTELGTQSLFTPADPLQIGLWAANRVIGHIQDFRIYKGVAKYKGGFDVSKPYTPVGIATWRAVPDCTANNFATLNPLGTGADLTYSNGNLSSTSGSSSTRGPSIATMGVTQAGTEKYYWEFLSSSPGSNNALSGLIGLGPDITDGKYAGYTNQYGIGYYVTGETYIAYGGALTVSSYGATYTDGDIIGVALDMGTNNGTLTFYKNGVSQGVAATGLGAYLTSGAIHAWVPGFGDGSSGQSVTHNVNFGQNPTFCGLVAAGTNADGNGKGLFKYAPPTGFLALCEDNLPTPTIADPGDYFKTVLWTGDGQQGRSITGVGFQPDFVWIKKRSGGTNRDSVLFDTVRGPAKQLKSSSSTQEGTNLDELLSFDEDGFDVGSGDNPNGSGNNYVAWCWKAGGAAVSNTDGSIASQVSVNQDAGFSIVTYTSTGSNTATETVGHGLNKTPNMIILKNRSAAVNWRVYHSGINDAGKNSVTLNSTEAAYVFWPSVGSDTFGLANSTTTGQAAGTGNQDIVAYCWAEIEGFSKFGSYVGNGNADGPFVYCGFKPAFILLKKSSTTGNWNLFDSSRNSTNPVSSSLFANLSNIENTTSSYNTDFLSNGFKIRTDDGSWNDSAVTYIFAAFAESPFQTANAK